VQGNDGRHAAKSATIGPAAVFHTATAPWSASWSPMSSPIEPELAVPFTVVEPTDQTVPLVFNAPHAGAIYPQSFVDAARLDPLALRRSEDAYVDALFAGMSGLGAPMLVARFPRAYLDVNREPYELDPRMFDGRLPPYANTRSLRVAGGLGTIPRIVGDGQEIYAHKLPVAEAMRRIEWLYKPYHRALRQLVMRTQRRFGIVLLIDCHSMPSSSVTRDENSRADIVIGDRFGTSCAAATSDRVAQCFERLGYRVARNRPYAGGFITEHYGEPAAGRHALQVEINRSLYMDERTMQRTEGFARLASDITEVFSLIAETVTADLTERRLAAE